MEENTARRTYKSRDALDREIVKNAYRPFAERKTVKELAEEFDFPPQAVRHQTLKLRKDGLMPKSASKSRTAGPNGAAPVQNRPNPIQNRPNVDAEDLWNRVAAGEIVDDRTRRTILSQIVAAGTDQYRILAIRELNSMDSSQDRGVGPPPPSTREERVALLTRILTAAGPDDSRAAMEAAFGTRLEVQGNGEAA